MANYKFTTQQVIDRGAELYDNQGFTRPQIICWLKALLDNKLADFEFDRMFDLIVG